MTALTTATPELLAEVERLATDYEYWAARVARILDKNTNVLRPLVLTPGQRALSRVEAEERRHRPRVRLLLLKARQGGFTTEQQARALHLVTTTPHVHAAIVLDTLTKMREVFGVTTRMLEEWPADLLWLRPEVTQARETWLEFPLLDSRLVTNTAGGQAPGRGVTLHRLHGSEFAFWPDPLGTLAAYTPSLERDGTTIVLETTAGVYGSPAHEFYRDALDPVHPYRVVVLPWWRCEVDREYRLALAPEEAAARNLDPAVEPEEASLAAAHGLTLEHLKWRRGMMRQLGPARFLQEYLEDGDGAWLVGGAGEYDRDLLRTLRLDEERDPARPARTVPNLHGGTLTWWQNPRALHGPCVLGADVAQGVGRDRSTLVVRHVPPGGGAAGWQRVADYGSSTVDPIEFAKLIERVGRECRDAFLVVEANGSGATVLNLLRRAGYRADRFYYRPVGRAGGLTRQGVHRGREAGWWTDAGSKVRLIDGFRELLNAALDGEADAPVPEALTDAFSAVRDERGHVELNGRDFLVAEALAWVGREQALRAATVIAPLYR